MACLLLSSEQFGIVLTAQGEEKEAMRKLWLSLVNVLSGVGSGLDWSRLEETTGSSRKFYECNSR